MLFSRHTRRREFITLLGGAAAWPLAAWAQPTYQKRRVGVLMHMSENHTEGQARVAAFREGLQELGWIDGRNLRLEVRWGAGDAERIRRFAAELVALRADVIFASASNTVAALQKATRTVPIVFAAVIDPIGAGFVESMARPGGNSTGFVAFEYAIAAKWLELLKEIAPAVTRAAVLRDPTYAAGIGQFAAIQAVGPIGMELQCDRRPRRRRDRACCCGICTRREGRADCDRKPVCDKSSGCNPGIGGPVQAARSVSFPLLRRPDLLWA
jgi:putative ABC transport system substrate-binding protein